MTATATDVHTRSRNLRHLYPNMGFKLEALGFYRNPNSRGLSCAYVTCMYCDLSMKTNTYNGMWRKDCECIYLLVLPAWAHGWRSHYMGQYRRSGISAVYLWQFQQWWSPNVVETYRVSVCNTVPSFEKFSWSIMYQAIGQLHLNSTHPLWEI